MSCVERHALWAMTGKLGIYHVPETELTAKIPWAAGMSMLFDREGYLKLRGFDEGYFLYYEDVDVCARAWRVGIPILLANKAVVVHDARRQSRRSLRYFLIHLRSVSRYLWRHSGRLPRAKDSWTI